MTEGELAKQLVDALTAAADREAGASTGLVSIAIERVAASAPERIQVEIERKTRTLLFLHADAMGAAGRVAIAASVHKVLA